MFSGSPDGGARTTAQWGWRFIDGYPPASYMSAARSARRREQLALPLCNAQFGRPMVPYFMPMIVPCDDGKESGDKSPHSKGHWYLADDYSFCERARQCDYRIMADPSIRLWHIGEYAYGWEDAGQDRQSHDSFTFFLNGRQKA
jgi:hypothetical protein